MGLLGELKINYLKISLFECELRPGCSTETAGKTDDGSSARSRDERTPRRPFEGDAPKTLSKRISDFTSQSAERSHRRLSLTKPGKSQSFYSLSAAAALHSWAEELHLLPPPPTHPPASLDLLAVPLPVCLKVLDFSSAEKEQARTGKMNDINGQPILPGTCD